MLRTIVCTSALAAARESSARHRSGRPRRSARRWSRRWRGGRAGAAAAGPKASGRRRRSADRHRPAAARRSCGWRCGRRASPSRCRAARCRPARKCRASGAGCQAMILLLAAELGGVEEGVPVDAGGAASRNRRGPRFATRVRVLRGDRARHGRGRSSSRGRRCARREPPHRRCPSASTSGRYRRDRWSRTCDHVRRRRRDNSRGRAGRGRPAADRRSCGPAPAGPARRTGRTDSRYRSWWRSADRHRRAAWRRARRKARGGPRSHRSAARSGWSGAMPRASMPGRVQIGGVKIGDLALVAAGGGIGRGRHRR